MCNYIIIVIWIHTHWDFAFLIGVYSNFVVIKTFWLMWCSCRKFEFFNVDSCLILTYDILGEDKGDLTKKDIDLCEPQLDPEGRILPAVGLRACGVSPETKDNFEALKGYVRAYSCVESAGGGLLWITPYEYLDNSKFVGR